VRLVVLESPFKADSAEAFARNLAYREMCIRDCALRGDAPYASHKMMTDALDDSMPEQRALGISCGEAWLRVAEAVVIYVDLGVSAGMLQGINAARRLGKPLEERMIFGERGTLYRPVYEGP